MSRRWWPLVVLGGVALAMGGCSSSKPAKTGSTVNTALASSTPTVAVTSAAATVPPASATTIATATTVPTSTTAAGATTTVAGRVVTSPSDNVHLGDTGPGVKQIQTALNQHGYKVTVDGQFGPQTAQAVKNFQKASGLKQDGIVGPLTWAKLQAAPTATTTKPATTTTA